MSRYEPTIEGYEAFVEVPEWFRAALSRTHRTELELKRSWWKGQYKPLFLEAVRRFAATPDSEIAEKYPRIPDNRWPRTWDEGIAMWFVHGRESVAAKKRELEAGVAHA